MKKCRTCKQEKILARFYKRPDIKDGRYTSCIQCMLEAKKPKDQERADIKTRITEYFKENYGKRAIDEQ